MMSFANMGKAPWVNDHHWGHRVIDAVTLLDGTKSHERFNAGG
jgi:hypothetical protein